MSFRLDAFSMSQMILCGQALRSCADGAVCMEEAAQNIVDYLYEAFRYETADGEEKNACALLRLFKTHPFAELEQDQREFALGLLNGGCDSRSVPCLTLLASRGEGEGWNDRRRSRGHIAIPLLSEKALESFPMVVQLLEQLGLELGSVIKTDPELVVRLSEQSCGVFHIPRARGSRHIPDQDSFVLPYGIESIVGFGGVFPNGEIYAAILFTHVPVSREVAERFQTLSLHAKMALLPFTKDRIFMPATQTVEG